MTPIEPLLSTPQLCAELSKILGEKVHRDRIRRRMRMGLPHVIDRATGYPKFRLSEVVAWWTVPPKASKTA